MPWFLYFGTLSYPFFFDDLANIVYNLDIQDSSRIFKRLIYRSGFGMGQNDPSRPITFLTYALNFSLGGFTPFGYRLFNLLLHSCVTLLIFFLTKRLVKLNFREEFPLLPFFVAFIFACHPIHIEVATYISGRADGLATLFYLLSLLLFLKSDENKVYGPLSLITFTLSFWSKPIGVTFPLMVLLIDLLFLPRSDFRKRIWTHLSYWILLAGFLLFRILYLGGLGDRITDPFSQWTRISYLLTQPYAILKYIQLLFVPIGQSVDHFVSPSLGFLDLRTLIGLTFLSWLTFLTYLFGKKFPATSKWIWFSFLWFFITLSPTSSIFPINDAITERRLYLPSWGFFLAVGVFYQLIFSSSSSVFSPSSFRLFSSLSFRPRIGVRGRLQPESSSSKSRFLWISLMSIHILVLALLSWKRSHLFADPISPWLEAVRLYPKNYRAQYNLGNEYLRLKQFPQAKQHYESALYLKENLAEPHNNLGLISLTEGNFKEAELHFKRALQLKPDLRDAQSNLDNLHLQLKSKNKGQSQMGCESFLLL